jgi:LacI family transcriptional regulator
MSSPVSRERVAVFYRAMEAHDIPVREEYVLESHFLEPEEAGEFTRRLLELPEPPTCILYPDDLALIGGLNVIRSRGLRIPEDISLAGYDGVRFSQFMYPKLTTIQQDTDRIGGEAASRLVGIIKKPKTSLVERVVVEGILLRGESVGRVSY